MAHAYSHLFGIPFTGLRFFTVYGPWGRPDMALFLFIAAIEEGLGEKAEKHMMPMQPGDVPATAADIEKSRELFGFEPETPLREGIRRFLTWYREYYGV